MVWLDSRVGDTGRVKQGVHWLSSRLRILTQIRVITQIQGQPEGPTGNRQLDNSSQCIESMNISQMAKVAFFFSSFEYLSLP